MYSPELLSQARKRNPVYRSSSASEHDHRHHSESATDTNEKAADYDDIQISPSTFMSMCPALLVQLEQRSCVEQAELADHAALAKHSEAPEFKKTEIGSYCKLKAKILFPNA